MAKQFRSDDTLTRHDPDGRQDLMNSVVSISPHAKMTGRIITGQEVKIEAFRQWSALLAEQVFGWGGLVGGISGIADPQVVPQLISGHPIDFCCAGAAILSGKKFAKIFKAISGAI